MPVMSTPTASGSGRDDGVSVVVDALRAAVRPGGRVGAELGPETRIEMPAGDFLRIRDALTDRRFEDASRVLRPLRMVKSEAEIARYRRITQIASEAFARPEAQTAQIQRPTTTSQVRQIPANPPFPKRPEQDSNLRPTP